MPVDRQQLDACLETIAAVSALPTDDPQYREVERAVATLVKSAKRRRRRERRQQAAAADQALLASCFDKTRPREHPAPLPEDEPAPATLHNQRMCSICKQGYRDVHPRYPHHCRACGDRDWSRRNQRVDLRGRRALITGGRVKIGHALALKMLRDGAHVAITTRFPTDAARRFAAQPDADTWRERLEICPLHLGELPGLLRWIESRRRAWPHLDIIVNNAAQTVRRPPEYYARWAALERERALVPIQQRALAVFHERCLDPAAHPEQFPLGAVDEEGLPLDLRPRNSWKLSAHEVAPIEFAEVMVVNALAPFLLTTRLTDLLQRSPQRDRYVVHASALEGQFRVRRKMPRHPHTNMAKAALNMFTRTSGESYARMGVYMSSVDTGWVTNENPQPQREAQRARGFRAPLDVEDGAARLYDPIARGVAGAPIHSVLLKDYAPVPW